MQMQFRQLLALIIEGKHQAAYDEVAKYCPALEKNWGPQSDPLYPEFASCTHRGIVFYFGRDAEGRLNWSDFDDL